MAETNQELNQGDSIKVKELEDVEQTQNVDVTAEGKNVKQIKCQRCPSTILVSETATLVTNEFVLPGMKLEKEDKQSDDLSHKYWCVENMYAFENVGFSKTVDGVKYLICADCEIGPIGWHDLNSKLSYVSLCRITYC